MRRTFTSKEFSHLQRMKALRAHLSGNARKNDGTLMHVPAPVTLPTLSEIEAKYGPLNRASGVRLEMASRD